LYARVSTLQQEQEATIESQIATLERFAHDQGYQVAKEFYFLDQAVSGAQLARPALDRLRDQALEGGFEVVLCLSPDRLARQYAHQWVLLDELHRAGIRVVFANQAPIPDDPQGQLLLGVQGLFAEYERAMITERLRRGKLHRMRQNQRPYPAPYGYRYVSVAEPGGGRWEIDPREAAVVRQIFTWYTAPNGPTIWQLVRRLNELGGQAPPRGSSWNYSTVQYILKQAAYTGQTHFNRTRICAESVGKAKQRGRGRMRRPRREPRPPVEWVPMTVPALLSVELWQSVQEKLAMRQKFAPRNNHKHFYLLRSLLVCGVCGHSLSGHSEAQGVIYRCYHGGKSRSPDVPAHRCALPGEVIEPLVWQAVCDLLGNPTLLGDAWKSQGEPAPAKPEEAEHLRKRLRVLERQRERLLDLYQEEQISKAELLQRKERIEQERQTIEQHVQSFERLQQVEQAKEQMLEDFAKFCREIEVGLENPTPELKQEVIRLLIDHIVVGDDEIVIKHIVPTDDDFRLLPVRK